MENGTTQNQKWEKKNGAENIGDIILKWECTGVSNTMLVYPFQKLYPKYSPEMVVQNYLVYEQRV